MGESHQIQIKAGDTSALILIAGTCSAIRFFVATVMQVALIFEFAFCDICPIVLYHRT